MSSMQIAKIVWCGLAKHHPDVTLDEVLDFLNPADQSFLFSVLIEQFFPGINKIVEDAQTAEKTGGSPNVQAPVDEAKA